MLIVDDANFSRKPETIGGWKLVEIEIFRAGIIELSDGGLAYRDPEQWLAQKMLERCVGLPASFTGDLARPAGIVFSVPFRRGDVARAFVRLLDEKLAEITDDLAGDTEILRGELVFVPANESEEKVDGVTVQALPRLPLFLKLSFFEGESING